MWNWEKINERVSKGATWAFYDHFQTVSLSFVYNYKQYLRLSIFRQHCWVSCGYDWNFMAHDNNRVSLYICVYEIGMKLHTNRIRIDQKAHRMRMNNERSIRSLLMLTMSCDNDFLAISKSWQVVWVCIH